jgi:hypothetical protein
MKGCVLHGKVEFPDGPPPLPRWPDREAGRAGGVPDGRREGDT